MNSWFALVLDPTRLAITFAGRCDDRRIDKRADLDSDRFGLQLAGDRLEQGLVQFMIYKALRKRTKAVRSGVGSEAENPQNRRKEARSSSASASFTSDKSYQTASSIALNNAGGGHAGSPLAAQEIKLTWRSIAVQSIRFESSSSDERGPASHSDALSAAVSSEIERFRGNSHSDWFYAFLDAFPTPTSITVVTKEAFIAAAWDVIGRKVIKTQILMDIYETARTSIGLPLPLDAPPVRMFRMVVAEARSLIQQRSEIETQADELLRHSQDYQLLRQIPGIGPINALTIIAEAGDLRRFRHHRQFLKFCGLDLWTQQSVSISWTDLLIQIRQRTIAPHPVDRRTGCHPPTREWFPT